MEAKICTPKKEMVQEHEHLVKTLRTGSRKKLKEEAADQAKELSGYRKAKGRKSMRGTNRR
jgi:hypothetical protein